MPDVFDVVYDTYGRDGLIIVTCHCCWLDIRMRSYPHNFGCFNTKIATKSTKRAATRDCDDRNLPHVFDVVYDAHGRDGLTLIHRMRDNAQYNIDINLPVWPEPLCFRTLIYD